MNLRRCLMMMMAVPVAACEGAAFAGDPGPAAQPVALRCEYLENPLGIDAAAPRLSWVLESSDLDARGLRQTAYQVLVASSRAKLDAGKGDLWDSGKVRSADSCWPLTTTLSHSSPAVRSSGPSPLARTWVPAPTSSSQRTTSSLLMVMDAGENSVLRTLTTWTAAPAGRAKPATRAITIQGAIHRAIHNSLRLE